MRLYMFQEQALLVMSSFSEQVESLKKSALEALNTASDLASLEEARVTWLGSNSQFNALLRQLGKLPAWTAQRRANTAAFYAQLADLPAVRIPQPAADELRDGNAKPLAHRVMCRDVDSTEERDSVTMALPSMPRSSAAALAPATKLSGRPWRSASPSSMTHSCSSPSR